MEQIKMKLKTDYIGDDEKIKKVIDKNIENNHVILLVSPQGTGKSEYLKKLDGYKRLFVSPTLSTAKQVEEAMKTGIARGRSFYTFSIEGAVDTFGNVEDGGITSTTFGSADGIVNNQLVYDYDVLIVDEIHKLVQYSTFGFNNVIATLNTINSFLENGKKVILTTATPELLKCLEGIEGFPQIDVKIEICNEKQFISKCIVEQSLSTKKMVKLIKQNHTQDNFQIALYNNKEVIKEIEKQLNSSGIQTISVNGQEYRDNEKIQKQINDIKNGNYHGYSVLLATSWIDAGLNFSGDNITHIYCVFDSFYNNGDLTVIKQFMARTRKCKPILYINYPFIQQNEMKLINQIIEKGLDSVLTKLEEVSKKVLNDYSNGYIREINKNHYYGIYELRNNEYEFSNITLNYQLYKLEEKNEIRDSVISLKEKINVNNLIVNKDENDEFNEKEYFEFIDNIQEDTWYSIQDINEFIEKITNNRIHRVRPKQFLENEFKGIGLKITTKNKSIDGISKRGYLFNFEG